MNEQLTAGQKAALTRKRRREQRADRKYRLTIGYYEDLARDYNYVMDRQTAINILRSIDQTTALDFETTGLYAGINKVRLSCLYNPQLGSVLIDHKFAGSFEELVEHYLGNVFMVYNAKFEYSWFINAVKNDASRLAETDIIDVDFMAKTKLGGHPTSLAKMVKRDLGIELSKVEQLSDWRQERLTNAQLLYASLDGVLTYQEYVYWKEQLTEEQIDAIYTMNDAVPYTIECEQTGMELDVDWHNRNIKKWKMKQSLMLKRIRKYTNENVLKNPNSDRQVSDLIKTQLDKDSLAAWPKTEKTEQLSLNRKIVGPIAANAQWPFSRWLNSLIRYRYYNKYLSTYGETLVTKQNLEGRISFRLNMAQAATIRYSSSNINIQNIPRAWWVRKAFIPPQPFKIFVVADYSSIEVRTLAEITKDPQLLDDAIYGDVHSSSAATIYGYDEDEFISIVKDESHKWFQTFKAMRSVSKAFTFQLIYGASAPALSVVLRCSIDEAEEAIRKWAERYPKAYNYRYTMFDHMSNTGYLPIVDGRTIYIPKMDRTLPVAANYGVQSAAASAILRAEYHVWRIRNEVSHHSLIRNCASVHDELVIATFPEHEKQAKMILEKGMQLGWLDVFPDANTRNLVDAKSGPTWGDAK